MAASILAPQPAAVRPAPEAILEQVERLVGSPLFRNSKRYTGLLRYVVTQTLEGQTALLKERLLGIEVFGRDAEYDTNHDPVVRTSAVEIRKRLAQYYDDPAHSREVRITLPAGSYTPEFSLPAPVDLVSESEPAGHTPARITRPRRLLLAASVAVISCAGLLAWSLRTPPNPVDEFWLPIRDTTVPVLFGVSGGPRPAPAQTTSSPTLVDLFNSREDYVPFGDVSALVDLAGYLRSHAKPYRLQYLSTVTFQDLKSGPAVFIGPASRLIDTLSLNLRFSIHRDNAVTRTWIQDSRTPDARPWSADVNAPAAGTAETYALITRLRPEATRQVLITVSGLSPYATSAAGDLLSHPDYLKDFASQPPRIGPAATSSWSSPANASAPHPVLRISSPGMSGNSRRYRSTTFSI